MNRRARRSRSPVADCRRHGAPSREVPGAFLPAAIPGAVRTWPVIVSNGSGLAGAAIRSLSRPQPGLRCDAGRGDQVMELVATCYAQLGVGPVQMGGDRAGRWGTAGRRSRCWSVRGWQVVSPRLASRMISRCCAVSSASAPGAVGAAVPVIPRARRSASARRVHGPAPRRQNVSRAAARTGLASLIRRCRRSHSPYRAAAWPARTASRLRRGRTGLPITWPRASPHRLARPDPERPLPFC